MHRKFFKYERVGEPEDLGDFTHWLEEVTAIQDLGPIRAGDYFFQVYVDLQAGMISAYKTQEDSNRCRPCALFGITFSAGETLIHRS